MSTTYEALRASNIARNRALLADLGLERSKTPAKHTPHSPQQQAKRRKLRELQQPTRVSARLAAGGAGRRGVGSGDESSGEEEDSRGRGRGKKKARKGGGGSVIRVKRPAPTTTSQANTPPDNPNLHDIETLRANWTSWTPSAPPPTRDPTTGKYHFPSHPTFTPNVSPADMLSLGVFGGSYFRPLYSTTLRTTLPSIDHLELPPSWLANLSAERHLTSPTYNPTTNKYGVKCGQSIEEWEAAGWINHEYDVRGWFQWYTRFWRGRRCADDERQVGRWSRCVGERGRWRRVLLAKYGEGGVREVWDDGGDDDEGVGEVSPVVHQTCLQWGWEVRQDELDRYWDERG